MEFDSRTGEPHLRLYGFEEGTRETEEQEKVNLTLWLMSRTQDTQRRKELLVELWHTHPQALRDYIVQLREVDTGYLVENPILGICFAELIFDMPEELASLLRAIQVAVRGGGQLSVDLAGIFRTHTLNTFFRNNPCFYRWSRLLRAEVEEITRRGGSPQQALGAELRNILQLLPRRLSEYCLTKLHLPML